MRRARIACLTLLLAVAPAFARADTGAEAREFGAAITLTEPTALADVLEQPDRYASQPVLLRGRIAEVCQKKGCWTMLQDGPVHVRVRFRDYGFFLPKDCIGDEALVQGTVQVRTLSEDEARHYEAETRGGDPARIDGPQREVGFVASGVRLVGRRDAAAE